MGKALRLNNGKLEIIQRPVPQELHPDEVLIRVAYSGVCGTDLRIISGNGPPMPDVVVMGHEYSGVAEKVGSAVKHVAPGDKVAVNPIASCGNCTFCMKRLPNFCDDGGLSFFVGVQQDGGFAKYSVVPAKHVLRLDADSDLAGGVFIEPLSTVIHGFDRLSPIAINCDILISGGGMIGLLWACTLHHHGYKRVVISEVVESRRNLIEGLNLGYSVVHPKDIQEEAKKLSERSHLDCGFDIAIDCTGVPIAIESAFKQLRKGGKFLMFGCCPKDQKMNIDPHHLYLKELTVIATRANAFAFPRAIQLTQDMGERYLTYDKTGIKTFKLEDYEHALAALKQGDVMKAVFDLENDS